MSGHGIRLGDGRRLEVVRTAPPEDPGRLRRTIEALRAGAGAGAVEIISASDDGASVELVLAFAGRSPVAPMAATDLGPIAAALAACMSDLHLRRVVHGALLTEHVLVDASGVVRLCGFAGDDASPANDVHAFGALVRELLDPNDASSAADALRAAAERCMVSDANARPSMGAIAASLASAPRRLIVAPPRPPRPRPRWPLAVGAVTALAVIGLVALPRGSRAGVHRISVATTTTTVAWAGPTAHTFEAAGSAWEIGTGDDIVVTGDFDCDSVETPAVVQRSGAIFLVDDLPEGDEVRSRYLESIPGAVDAHVEHAGACDRLVVVTDRGEITVEV